MGRLCADRFIMFAVIGLVAWAIIGLPILNLWQRSHDEPSHEQTSEQSYNGAKGDNPWLTKDAAGFFTFGLVLVGSFQVGLFLWQLRLIRRSLDDAKIAANAARDGARAARDSADISKLSMVASERAYVHFNGCRWISHNDRRNGHVFWRIHPQWINSGNTPTRGLRIYIQYELLDAPLRDDYSFQPNPNTKMVLATIAPKGVIQSDPYDIYGTDLVKIDERRKHFYIWGIATYRDVFPDTPQHVTKFCIYARTITGDPTKLWDDKNNPVGITFPHFSRHNCSDEDCEGQT